MNCRKISFLVKDDVYLALKSLCDVEGYDTVQYGLSVLVTSSLCALGYLPLPKIPAEGDEE